MLRPLTLLLTLAALVAAERVARAQACCVGASGLTPGWLTNHERALVGAQLRLSQTHGTYPSSGPFYVPTPGRDARVETSLFATYRLFPRAQVSAFMPLVTTRRRSGAVTEHRTAFGDFTLVGRYDLIRAGESTIPGIAILAGAQAPTGKEPSAGTGLLAADVNGIGSWEVNGGVSIEQTFGHVVLHGTVLAGYRFPATILGEEQRLGPRALYLVAGGWVFDSDVALLGTLTHASDGDATLAGEDAVGTGFRSTQLAFLVVAPLTDTLRLRTSVFTDVPPLGRNRPALGGTSISLAKTWF
ncbi:MAG: hypothetical protein KIT84_09160 [Labilithrix sp.]|nr:hypothetical protein [Labilithrix sp.]